jgi:hypothetical protein
VVIVNSIAIGGIVFVCTFGGAMIGMYASSRLPDQHLSAASTAVIRLAMAFLVALTTLVISLMISSARVSFTTKDAEYRRGAADIVMLDRALAHYGPETKDARDLLRRVAETRLREFWPEDTMSRQQSRPIEIGTGIEQIEDALRALEPKDNAQRSLQARALQIGADIETLTWLLAEQGGSAIRWPTLIILIFWLTMIFTSFGFSAPRNATVVATLFVCSLSIAGAMYLLVQLDQPYGGYIKVSSAPLRAAIDQLGR